MSQQLPRGTVYNNAMKYEILLTTRLYQHGGFLVGMPILSCNKKTALYRTKNLHSTEICL